MSLVYHVTVNLHDKTPMQQYTYIHGDGDHAIEFVLGGVFFRVYGLDRASCLKIAANICEPFDVVLYDRMDDADSELVGNPKGA